MTEHWRKKLGDLDRQGPGEDVFERAKGGPTHAEDVLPGAKTSTRIITAVAAFAVFALAISVFAIPALRMQTGAAGGTSGLFPLWPSQTPEQLQQLQADADSGAASWTLDPRLVATRFAQQVLGWQDVSVDPAVQRECAGLTFNPDTGSIVYPDTSSPSVAGAGSIGCLDGRPSLASAVSLGSLPPSLSSGGDDDGAFMTYPLGRCPVDRSCLTSPLQEVTVYQPLEQGEGQIWAVFSAQDQSAHLSVLAGQNVRSGATIAGTFNDADPALGFASCGAPTGSSSYEDIIPGDRISLDAELQASETCEGAQPGYVWGAVGDPTLIDRESGGVTRDPIADGSTCGADACLDGITAVPVVMTFPEFDVQHTDVAQPSQVETSVPSPINEPTTWRSFTNDSVGWTMQVPTTWKSVSIANTQVTGMTGSGQEFTGDGLTVDVFQVEVVVMPADDSTYPLDYDSLLSPLKDGALVGMFRGNGEPVSIRVVAEGSQVTPEQEAILRHMVSSISFPHLQPGDRDGMVAALADPRAQDQWMQVGDMWLILKQTPDGYVALAPVTCREGGQLLTRWDPSSACPDSTALSQWSADGSPDAGNATGFQHPLDVHPVVRAWDGTLLAVLGFTRTGASASDVSPTTTPLP
jgi:hypothetical protein